MLVQMFSVGCVDEHIGEKVNCSFGLVSCGGNVEVCVYRGIGKRKKERKKKRYYS